MVRRRLTIHDLPGDETDWPKQPDRWGNVPAADYPEKGFVPRDETETAARGETDYMDWLLRTIDGRIEEDQRKQALDEERTERARREPCPPTSETPRGRPSGPRNYPSTEELATMSKGRRYYYRHREEELARQRIYRAKMRLERREMDE